MLETWWSVVASVPFSCRSASTPCPRSWSDISFIRPRAAIAAWRPSARLKIQAYGLKQELTAAKADRAIWEHRVALLRSDQIDRDLLEERARIVLGRVHANDVVIINP